MIFFCKVYLFYQIQQIEDENERIPLAFHDVIHGNVRNLDTLTATEQHQLDKSPQFGTWKTSASGRSFDHVLSSSFEWEDESNPQQLNIFVPLSESNVQKVDTNDQPKFVQRKTLNEVRPAKFLHGWKKCIKI